MKKMITAAAAALALGLTFGLGACSETGGFGGAGSAENGKFGDFTTAESVYGFSAASAGMLISAMDLSGAPSSVRAASSDFGGGNSDGQTSGGNADSSSDTAALPDETKEELDGYMTLVESLLSDGGFGMTAEASDREGYAEKMTVSWRDMQGNTSQYVMYYNQTAIPDFDDDDDDDDWDDRFDDEREENYAIEGVMTVEGVDYAVQGRRSAESEGDESESETTFRVTLGENRYMLVEQETESERGESEQSYSYSVYEGGRAVERASFSYEEEDGETELEMTAYKDGQTQRFSFDRESERGREYIRLTVGTGGGRQSWRVMPQTDENGSVTYAYEPIGSRR